jgi:hypothetical protein
VAAATGAARDGGAGRRGDADRDGHAGGGGAGEARSWLTRQPIEILSPSTARFDRAEKLPIYARHGVRHAWLVEPDLRTLEVFENLDGKWLLLAVLEDAAAVSQPPFDAISFDLGALWAD